MFKTFRVSSHYWNNHKHKHNHKWFRQFLGKKKFRTFEISQIGLWFQSNWSFFLKKLQFYWLSWAEHCFFWLSIVLKTSTCCSFTNDHIPMIFLLVWVNTGQLYKYNCPMFTQTGRKTIGMWSFVKLQQVDVFKTMLNQRKKCSAQFS